MHAKILHTPGHTQDSIYLLVTDKSRCDEPWFLVSGHTLFVGSVGRPDLKKQCSARCYFIQKAWTKSSHLMRVQVKAFKARL
ncbi:hypothetical protein P8S54_04440 [Thiomicrospira sp. R3]|uniref:hypothetical protein n=1 Tax=Thiomicrospira sp. R3 TaxID=3035472 RepID=UPI00259B88DD|nr:hypothetical protein [Thiomicrospira sp. R3]WFE69554.1 hypothetical protein P8S54_04440 [Thiomicrospira sp. R3]